MTNITIKYGQTRTVVIKVHFRKKTLLGTIDLRAPSLIIWGRPLRSIEYSRGIVLSVKWVIVGISGTIATLALLAPPCPLIIL